MAVTMQQVAVLGPLTELPVRRGKEEVVSLGALTKLPVGKGKEKVAFLGVLPVRGKEKRVNVAVLTELAVGTRQKMGGLCAHAMFSLPQSIPNKTRRPCLVHLSPTRPHLRGTELN
eukprot:365970-Chlamydomonas_euryale.AAC.1